MEQHQVTDTVLMIEPSSFRCNPDAVETNSFMKQSDDPLLGVRKQAMQEFTTLSCALREKGIRVLQFPDTPEPETPDAVFPNNWFSTHPDNGGTVVLYPMCPPSRRAERRSDIIKALATEHGFKIGVVIDLSPGETDGEFLEGTGSLVLDRGNKLAYACQSPRTTQVGLERFATLLGYAPSTFCAYADGDGGQAVYHTNVVMSVGEGFAVICEEAISQSRTVRQTLNDSRHEIIPITLEQMHSFAGNMLQLRNPEGHRFIVMSDRARDVLTSGQIRRLTVHGEIISAPLTTIENHGGGSARCMVAEVFLPQR